MTDQSKTKYHCSFCAKSQDDVKTLIAGPGIFICDECVAVCVGILEERGEPVTAGGDPVRRGLMALAAYIGPECTAAVKAAMGDGQ